jgi:hypothetical protein
MMFGCFPSLFRGHWKMFWITLVVDIVALLLTFVVFRGLDDGTSVVVLRLVAALARNASLHAKLQNEGWSKDAKPAFAPINTPRRAANDSK